MPVYHVEAFSFSNLLVQAHPYVSISVRPWVGGGVATDGGFGHNHLPVVETSDHVSGPLKQISVRFSDFFVLSLLPWSEAFDQRST